MNYPQISSEHIDLAMLIMKQQAHDKHGLHHLIVNDDKSALRSAICSNPTATLTRPSLIPAAARASAVTRLCVVVAG